MKIVSNFHLHKRMEFVSIFKLKLLIYIFILNFFLTGILYQCIKWVLLPLFKSYGLAADWTQLYTSIIFLPYSAKPVFGILSDLISVRGYQKKYWLLLFILLPLIPAVVSLFIDNFVLLILTFIIYNFEIAITELLTEGVYTAIMKQNPQTGSDIVIFSNLCKNLGQLVSLAFLGPLIDQEYYTVVYIIMLVSAMTLFLPTVLNWLLEEKTNNHILRVDTDLFWENKKVFSLIFFSGISSLVLSGISVLVPYYLLLIISYILLIIILLGSYFSFSRDVFYIILYLVIVKISKPSLGSAMDYFYTADATCLPQGPHFDFKYYITYTGILGTIITLLAIVFYKLVLSKFKFRRVLVMTSILISLSGISDLLIVRRINIRWGIPDSYFYILGEAIIEKTISTLYIITISTLISKKCQDKMEASTYAFLSGVNEFSTFISKIEGILIFTLSGVKTVIPCDFSSLWLLILLCHILPPLLIGLPSIFLIPNSYQNIEEEDIQLL